MAITISQATIEDTVSIMKFIDDFWKKNHILAQNEEFFLYEFQEGTNLNIIIAKESDNNEIVGFLGYFYYNSNALPNMAGSIWKIHPEIEDQLIGIKIRNFFVKNIQHDFFATPGPGPHMKPVYKILRMSWQRMEQFYIANNNIEKFKLIKNPKIRKFDKTYTKNISIEKISTILDIKDYIFDEEIVPLKDKNYINKRYLNHPIYKYDVFVVKQGTKIMNIFVGRKVNFQVTQAYRLVDFIGDTNLVKDIGTFLYDFIHFNNFEYIDFIAHGYDANSLYDAGFEKLDLDSDKTIVPNYFEPFVQKNVPIYCVADKTDKIYRQHKADGDMDRPSSV